MKLHPITGPVPPEKFAALIGAPYGEAKKVIRKYDPLWGVKEGEKISWRVEASCECYGTAFVEAASQEEAKELAKKLSGASFDWEPDTHGGISIELVVADP